LGRFVGAKHVKTKYIQFLDGDMTVDERWINIAIKKMEANHQVAAVLGYKKVFSKNFNDYYLLKDKKEYEPDYMGGAFCVKTRVYNNIGGFDIRLPAEEERDLYVKIKHNSSRVLYLHSLMASHYDFKSNDRGLAYILSSYRSASIFLPFVSAVKNKMLPSWFGVYKKAIPALFADITSLILLILSIFSFIRWDTSMFVILTIQLSSLIYSINIKRRGYFIIWKVGFINIVQMTRILNRKVIYSTKIED
jgi:GT2 family glycosyltransferase